MCVCVYIYIYTYINTYINNTHNTTHLQSHTGDVFAGLCADGAVGVNDEADLCEDDCCLFFASDLCLCQNMYHAICMDVCMDEAGLCEDDC